MILWYGEDLSGTQDRLWPFIQPQSCWFQGVLNQMKNHKKSESIPRIPIL
jgi:hypothetical protein